MSRTNPAEEIADCLIDTAQSKNVWVLRAKDHGSRARALDDEDSDYDVHFIFAQQPSEYAVRPSYVDTIDTTIPPEETALDAPVELHGWNIQKFVGDREEGLASSGAMALQFVNSDVVYYTSPCTEEYWNALETHVAENFKPYDVIGHERSKAASNYGKYIEGDYTFDASEDELLDIALANAHDGEEMKPQVNYEDSEVTSQSCEIVTETTVRQVGHLDIEDAIDEDIVRETTQDVTTKRYVNVLYALFRARYVERTRELPPMDANELLREMAGDIPEDVYAFTGDLYSDKCRGLGERTPSDRLRHELDAWIESELARDVPPEEYVGQRPNVDVLEDIVVDMLDTAY